LLIVLFEFLKETLDVETPGVDSP